MDTILYLLARGVIGLLRLLPLRWVARIGRAGGAAAYWLDGRHRRIALANISQAFKAEKSPEEIRAIARENFRRIGENYACAARTAFMTEEELRPHIELSRAEKIPKSGSLIVAIGHFGNFEIYARLGMFLDGFKFATTYRGLRQPALNRLLLSLRERSGCLFFERRTQVAELKAAMNAGGIILGLLSDQHAGNGGVWVPFLGRECSTTSSPAVLAQRYECALFTGICYRIGLGRWRLEAGNEIKTRDAAGKPRSTEDVMTEVNLALEKAVRRDPANWFWVHNRWKQRPVREPARPASPVPCA